MTRSTFAILLLACAFLSIGRRAECADATSQASQITIDASKTREPLSKYVYGQFIEHLGRCIYGGIWAEMLEDRKFFDPVGAKESPWKAIGPADRVTMDRVNPFVGADAEDYAGRQWPDRRYCSRPTGLAKRKAVRGPNLPRLRSNGHVG